MQGAITIDLPYPPSVNHVWRFGKGRAYRSAKYIAWIEEASLLWITQKSKQPKKIAGPFSLELQVNPPDKRRRDLDNVLKPVLDLVQNLTIVSDDSLCGRLLVERCSKDAAPLGARLVLRPLP